MCPSRAPDPLAPQPAPRPAPHQASGQKGPRLSSHPVWETRWPAVEGALLVPHPGSLFLSHWPLSADDWASMRPHRRGSSRPEPVLAAGTIPSQGPLACTQALSRLPRHLVSTRPGPRSCGLCRAFAWSSAEPVSLHQLLRRLEPAFQLSLPLRLPLRLLPKVASPGPGPPYLRRRRGEEAS